MAWDRVRDFFLLHMGLFHYDHLAFLCTLSFSFVTVFFPALFLSFLACLFRSTSQPPLSNLNTFISIEDSHLIQARKPKRRAKEQTKAIFESGQTDRLVLLVNKRAISARWTICRRLDELTN